MARREEVATQAHADGAGWVTHARQPGTRRQIRVAMVSDFFYPRLGGVEMHIWALAQCLISRGHKVIVVTNTYGHRKGVRYMTNGLKVYYVPMTPIVDQDSMPTLFAFFALFRNILLRERIEIVHGHQATSTLMHECILHARTMGYKALYTDHSLFGFADAASINLNKVMKFTMSDVDHAIAVSHTCRENLVLRASLAPSKVSAIPNAVDPSKFVPDPEARKPTNTINVVMISRLVYRKGIDLAARVIPIVAKRFPHVHFIIGGDGPKKLLLEEMREKHQLHDRVELLGAVPHAQVRNALVRGHVFLNCSLTESFCIAILEAACCGLYVVSTRVGGVPEVLPDRMIKFAEPSAPALAEALAAAIGSVKEVDPWAFHNDVRSMYSWQQVTERTMVVYDSIMAAPRLSLMERMRLYNGAGVIFGPICCAIVAAMFLYWRLLEWWWPASEVEHCPDFPLRAYQRHKLKLHSETRPVGRSPRRRRHSLRAAPAAGTPPSSSRKTSRTAALRSGGGRAGQSSSSSAGDGSRRSGRGDRPIKPVAVSSRSSRRTSGS